MEKLAAEESHHGSVELSSGKTISQGVMSVVELNVEPVTKGDETESVERVFPPVPYVNVID